MSAITVDRVLYEVVPNTGYPMNFPVLASERIYSGTLCGIDPAGYLVNLTSTNLHTVKGVVIATESLNDSIATNGSISGDQSIGYRTVGCLVNPVLKWVGCSGLAQTSVGKTAYVTTNNDLNVTGTGIKIGTVIEYIGSATIAFIEVNSWRQNKPIRIKLPLVAAASATVGATLQWANPTGVALDIIDIVLDLTTAATDTACGIDVGTAADATTNSDNLIDGFVIGTAGYYSSSRNGGTNGGNHAKLAAGGYINGSNVVSSHQTSAGAVGNFYITYQLLD